MDGLQFKGEDVALFIDWENFKISLAAGHRTPNVSSLKEEVANHGRVVVAKAYADWVTRTPELRGATQFINDPPALYAAGIEPVYVPTRLPPGGEISSQDPYRRVRVKNSVDVKMTADCIECAHSHPNIGTFVLVSGDSDFIHVINALRAMGKRVVIIGVSWSTSRRLADQVDGLILYDSDVDPITPPEPAPAPDVRATTRDNGPSRRDLPQIIRAIEDIVRAERQAGGTPLLTSIKQRLMRRFPGFDEKKLGFSGFKKLLLRVAQEGNIKVVTTGLVDWAVMADEPGPRETLPATQTEAPLAPIQDELGGDGEVALEALNTEEADEDMEGDPKPAETEALSAAAETLAEPEFDFRITSFDEAATPTTDAEPSALLADLELPERPADGQDAERVADLIVMADTLESREDVSHVAFNFLVSEICQALDEGLKAEHPEIVRRWRQAYSRPYITKMIRALGNGKIFVHGWHTWKDQASGQSKRRRTLRLNRAHPLVQKILSGRWEPPTALTPELGMIREEESVNGRAPKTGEPTVVQ